MRHWVLTIFVMALSGCGYTFTGGGSVLPPDVKRIFIPVVENNSTGLGLSQIVTEALQEQFDSYGVVTVVENRSEADAVLVAKILTLKRTTKTVTAKNNTALAIETSMEISAELRRITGPVLWRASSLKVSKGFSTDPSAVVTSTSDFASGMLSAADLASQTSRDVARGQEQEALNAIAEEAARQIYNKAVAPDF